MARRSQAQEDAVKKAGKVSGERRRAAAKRRQDVELREAQKRTRGHHVECRCERCEPVQP